MEDISDNIEIDSVDYQNFISAACDVAGPEFEKLVQAVIGSLCEMDATHLFGDVAARHLWDEYCWQLQEGPYDDDLDGFGSISEGFEDVLNAALEAELDKIPKHVLLFLSIYSRNEAGTDAGYNNIGEISRDNIAAAVRERVDQIASRRNIELIGPHRDDAISMEISIGGLAGKALSDAGECSDFVAEHADQLISGDSDDIAQVGKELLERYMQLLYEGGDDFLLSELLDRFDEEIRGLVLEKDIRPALENAVRQLQEALDEV